MVTSAPISRPTTGAYVWFGTMLASWTAFAALALFSAGTLADVWSWLQDLPLLAELLVWFLTLPWALALAVWESGWDDALRVVVVLLIAGGWTIVSIPRPPRTRVEPDTSEPARCVTSNQETDMTATPEPRLNDGASAQLRGDAIKRLKKKQDFHAHILVYTLVNVVLWAIWAIATADSIAWPIFPMAGWGVGLLMNAWDVYGRRPITERDVSAEIERLRRA